MDEVRHLWLEATPAVALGRPCAELSKETVKQIQLDLTRTFGPTLFQDAFDEVALNNRRDKVEKLLVQWLQSREDVAYMQGMHNLMAMSYRQVEADDGALQIFDFMIRQVDENFFHADTAKLFEACQSTSEKLQSMVHEVSPKMAEKLTNADVNFFPMIVQNWMIDMFINVLPIDAAARLWHRCILDNTPGTPGLPLKFGLHLLLSWRTEILTCRPENLNEVIDGIPKRIHSPQDVDALLEDWAAPAVPMMVENENWKVPTLKLNVLNARLPKRWRPWKFVALAMVVPWRFLHAAHQPCAFAARPPVSHRPSLKGLRLSLR